MRRTSIYLHNEQLAALRALSEHRGEPVATLVREAVDNWLSAQDVRRTADEQRQRRSSDFLAQRARIAEERGFSQEDVERDVMDAVWDARKARSLSGVADSYAVLESSRPASSSGSDHSIGRDIR